MKGHKNSVVLAVTDRVQTALKLAEGMHVDDGLEVLVDCEQSLLNSELASDAPLPSLQLHVLYWSMLQRASILNEVARFEESKTLLETIRFAARSANRARSSSLADCFCLELSSSTIELSNAMASEGNFAGAIRLLSTLREDLEAIEHVPNDFKAARIEALIDSWGDSLGYDTLSKKIDISSLDLEGRPRSGSIGDHWDFPMPLRGSVYARHHLEYVELRSEIRNLNDPELELKMLSIEKLCDVTQDWVLDVPYSIEAKFFWIQELLAKAEFEIELNDIESFLETAEKCQLTLSALIGDYPQYVQLRLSLIGSLFTLSRTIFYHQFDSDEILSRYAAVGRHYLGVCQIILEDIRSNAEVTQAVALTECILSNLAAIGQDMIDDADCARTHREHRDTILSEILRLDPSNDYAKRLVSNYELRQTIIHDGELPDGEWNWSVTQLA